MPDAAPLFRRRRGGARRATGPGEGAGRAALVTAVCPVALPVQAVAPVDGPRLPADDGCRAGCRPRPRRSCWKTEPCSRRLRRSRSSSSPRSSRMPPATSAHPSLCRHARTCLRCRQPTTSRPWRHFPSRLCPTRRRCCRPRRALSPTSSRPARRRRTSSRCGCSNRQRCLPSWSRRSTLPQVRRTRSGAGPGDGSDGSALRGSATRCAGCPRVDTGRRTLVQRGPAGGTAHASAPDTLPCATPDVVVADAEADQSETTRITPLALPAQMAVPVAAPLLAPAPLALPAHASAPDTLPVRPRTSSSRTPRPTSRRRRGWTPRMSLPMRSRRSRCPR